MKCLRIFAGDVRQHFVAVIQLNAELGIGQRLRHSTLCLDCFFFRHIPSSSPCYAASKQSNKYGRYSPKTPDRRANQLDMRSLKVPVAARESCSFHTCRLLATQNPSYNEKMVFDCPTRAAYVSVAKFTKNQNDRVPTPAAEAVAREVEP